MESVSNLVILNSSGRYRSCHGDADMDTGGSGSGDTSNHDDIDKEKILQVGLRYHCIFCLQKTGNANQTRSGIIPRAIVEPQFVNSFNEVWQYLRNSKRLSVPVNLEDPEIPIFSTVPPICQGCANLTQIVSSMLKALKLTVDEMQRKIRGARKGGECQWRFEYFEKKLRELTELVDRRHIPFVLKFVEFLDSGPMELGEKENQMEPEVDLPVKRPRRSTRISKRSDPPAPAGPTEDNGTGDKEVQVPSTPSVEDPLVSALSPIDNIEKTVDVSIVKSEHNDDCVEKEASMEYQQEPGQPENIDMQESNLNEDDGQGERISDMDYSPSEDEASDGDFPDPTYSETKRINKNKKPDRKSSKSSSAHEIIICEVKRCGKSFVSRKGYTFHKNMIHPETVTEKFPCSCGEVFLTKRRLIIHMKKNLATHPEYYSNLCKRKYVCDICGVGMSSEQILEHLKGHVGEEYVVKCPADKCRYVFTNNDTLLSHLIKTNCKSHPTGNISREFMLTCEACGYLAKTRIGLRGHVGINHERVTESEKKVKCPVEECDKRFNIKQSVDLHLNTHNYLNSVRIKQSFEHCAKGIRLEKMGDQAIKGFLCEQCGCPCSSEKELLEHLFEHRHSDCLYCFICKDQVRYKRHSNLRIHFSQVHQIECNEIICEECSESFWSEKYLHRHKEKYHSNSKKSEEDHVREFEKKTKKRHKCTDCPAEEDVGFATENGLISHKINVHGAEPFRCDECDDTFSNVDAFSRHQKEHAGIVIKKWKCEVEGCGKAFRKRTSLVYHKVAIHEEGGKRERTFVCDECGKSFYNAKSLRVHHQGVHLGVKRFVCDECGDRFFQKTALVYHMRRHTGERPFVCPICDQRFRFKDVLGKHVEGHEKKGAAFKPNGPMKVLRKRKIKAE